MYLCAGEEAKLLQFEMELFCKLKTGPWKAEKGGMDSSHMAHAATAEEQSMN